MLILGINQFKFNITFYEEKNVTFDSKNGKSYEIYWWHEIPRRVLAKYL